MRAVVGQATPETDQELAAALSDARWPNWVEMARSLRHGPEWFGAKRERPDGRRRSTRPATRCLCSSPPNSSPRCRRQSRRKRRRCPATRDALDLRQYDAFLRLVPLRRQAGLGAADPWTPYFAVFHAPLGRPDRRGLIVRVDG